MIILNTEDSRIILYMHGHYHQFSLLKLMVASSGCYNEIIYFFYCYVVAIDKILYFHVPVWNVAACKFRLEICWEYREMLSCLSLRYL